MDGFQERRAWRSCAARARARTVPVIVITAREARGEGPSPPVQTASVERILQKGAYGRDDLLAMR